jgi:hypothetical protein
MVKLEILQLPDYCEEYSIHPKGKKPPGVVLKDGWELVAVGSPPPPPPPAAPAPAPPPADATKLPEAVVEATNVPIGLYESVFDVAGPAKIFKGWRYIGFAPFGSSGPPNGTDAAGMQNLQNGCSPCVGNGSVMGNGPLYGLVFFNGVMTFRQIDEIGNNMTCPRFIKPYTPPEAGKPGIGGVQGSGGTPGTGGATTTPPADEEPKGSPAPPRIPAANPSTSRYSPRSYPLQADAGVRQTSSTSRRYGAKGSAKTKSATTPKAVDSKKLQALEAEVFKSLDYSPTGASSWATGSVSPASSAPAIASPSSVPALTPAMPLR